MIQIDDEFKALIPPLANDEYLQLKESILDKGCRDALVLWNDVLVDGHNRYLICTENDIEFKTINHDFDSRHDAKIWMITNQFARRNITNFVRAELALMLKPLIAKQAKAKEYERKTTLPKSAKSYIDNIDTRAELAKQANVSHDTIAKTETILKSADNETKEKLRAGDPSISINKAYQEIKKTERKEKQIETETKALNESSLIGFVVTDSQDVIKCDAVITDPPYGILNEAWDDIELESFTREWLSRWNDSEADVFISSWSQRYLFDARKWFDEELSNYKFQQLLIWHYPNNKSPQSRMGFKHTFEPIFFYRRNNSTKEIGVGGGDWGNGLNDFDCHVSAMPQSNFNNEDMKQHPAQKSLSVMKWLVNATTNKGDLIADPFCGSGTTGIACRQLDRHFHGVEKDKDYIELALKRIAAYE